MLLGNPMCSVSEKIWNMDNTIGFAISHVSTNVEY